MENCSKQMFVTLALVLLKLKVWWVFEHSSECLTQECWLYVQYYVQHYNETIYGTISFDIIHRIPKLESV